MHGNVHIHIVKLYDSTADKSHEQNEKLPDRILV